MTKTKVGKFISEGVPVEVFIDRKTSYCDLVQVACNNLDIPDCPGQEIALLTYSGAIIAKKEGWTVGEYMQQSHRGPSGVKFGVGFVKVCFSAGDMLPLVI